MRPTHEHMTEPTPAWTDSAKGQRSVNLSGQINIQHLVISKQLTKLVQGSIVNVA